VCVRIPNCPRFGCYELFNFKTFLKCSQFLAIPYGIMHYFNAPYQKPMLHIIFINNSHKQIDSHAPLYSQGRSSQNG
jgi:hypothetical protein